MLRDRPFMAVSLLSGLLTAHGVLYLTVMPLWILTHTDAPKTVIAALVLLICAYPFGGLAAIIPFPAAVSVT